MRCRPGSSNSEMAHRGRLGRFSGPDCLSPLTECVCGTSGLGTQQILVSEVTVARQEQRRGSASEFDEKPSPGHLPIAHDALGRNLQHFRRFLYAQSSEESELDDFCFAWVNLSELIQRVVNGYHLPVSRA